MAINQRWVSQPILIHQQFFKPSQRQGKKNSKEKPQLGSVLGESEGK